MRICGVEIGMREGEDGFQAGGGDEEGEVQGWEVGEEGDD